jgi:hypothetical protein
VISTHASGERAAWCKEVLEYLGQFKWAGNTADWASNDTTNLAMNCWCAPIYIAYKKGRLKKKTCDDFSMKAFQYPELSALHASQRAAYEFLKGALAGADEGVPGDLLFFYLDSLEGVYGKNAYAATVPLDKCPVHVAVNMGPGKCVSLWQTPNDYDKYQYCDTRDLVAAIERDRKAKCHFTSMEPFWIVGKKSKSACYITTATCRSLGLPDDCTELGTLRWFRDQVVMSTPKGARQVADYYASAPDIVARIDRRDDAGAIYAHIHHAYILPAVAAVERREFTHAHALFETMVRHLREAYGP